jgi:hypothetical protein
MTPSSPNTLIQAKPKFTHLALANFQYKLPHTAYPIPFHSIPALPTEAHHPQMYGNCNTFTDPHLQISQIERGATGRLPL